MSERERAPERREGPGRGPGICDARSEGGDRARRDSGVRAPDAPFPAVDAGTFDRRVARAEGPVLAVFVAPGCAPCDRVLGWLARRAGRLAPGVATVTVDVLAAPLAGLALRVRRVPTLALFHRGRLAARAEGPLPGPRLAEWLAHAAPRVPRRSGEVPKPKPRGRRRPAPSRNGSARPGQDEGSKP